MSDLAGPGNGVIVADDFMPFGDTISQLCVWGAYVDPIGTKMNMGDCTGEVVDHFRVRVFEDYEGIPYTGSGLVAEAEVTGSNIIRGPLDNSNFESNFGIKMHAFTLTLDTPITGLVSGQRYWLEVVNDTEVPLGNTCYWHWAQHLPDDSDGYTATGVGYKPRDYSGDILEQLSQYVNGSAHGGADMAFCLHGPSEPLDFESPPVRVAACWSCPDGNGLQNCTLKTLHQCNLDGGHWNRDDLFCNGWIPVFPNDDCWYLPASSEKASSGGACGDGIVDPGEQCDDGNNEYGDGCEGDCTLESWIADDGGGFGPLRVLEGVYHFDTNCANTDGPVLIRSEGGDTGIEGDLWFEYSASATGWMTVSTCPSQTSWTKDGFTGLDSVLAIYHENGTTCEDGFNQSMPCDCPGNPPNARCENFGQCPGGNGICKNQCPCPGDYPGVSPLQVGNGGDENCSGIADAGGGVQRLQVFPQECYVIRVGSWWSFAPGSSSRGRGLVDVALDRAECFPASPPQAHMGTSSTGTTVPWIKSRMISFQGGDAGRNQAVRVTWKSMPPGWQSWEGQSLFAQPPVYGTEQSGTSFYVDQGPGAPNSLVWSELGCEPFYTDWSQYGVVHLIYEAIAPTKHDAGHWFDIQAIYDIQIIDDSCHLQDQSQYSEPLEVRTAGWADVGELLSGDYVVPGDRINVVDTLGIVDKFSNQPGAPSKVNACLLGVTTGPVPRLDGKITVNELVAVLGAFGGENYPFGEWDIAPPPGACPP